MSNKKSDDSHHVSWKNFGLDDFLRAALMVYNHGLDLDNDQFLSVSLSLRRMRGGDNEK